MMERNKPGPDIIVLTAGTHISAQCTTRTAAAPAGHWTVVCGVAETIYWVMIRAVSIIGLSMYLDTPCRVDNYERLRASYGALGATVGTPWLDVPGPNKTGYVEWAAGTYPLSAGHVLALQYQLVRVPLPPPVVDKGEFAVYLQVT